MRKVKTYRNKRNANKFIELMHYDDGHYYWRQFLQWGSVRNYTGSKRGRFSRIGIRWAKAVLEDYEEMNICLS